MRHIVIGLAIALIIAMISIVAYAKEEPKVITPAKETPGMGTITATTPVMEENALVKSATESEKHLHKAHENFIKKDTKSAAAEIRDAAAFLSSESLKAKGKAKNELKASSQELGKLARDMEKGTAVSSRKVQGAFARTTRTISNYLYLKSQEDFARKETKNAGMELKAAADQFERAVFWAGEKAEKTTTDVITNTRLIAGKMMEGVALTSDESGKGMKALGSEIEKFARTMEPAKDRKLAKVTKKENEEAAKGIKTETNKKPENLGK